jgi:hypothetical protein
LLAAGRGDIVEKVMTPKTVDRKQRDVAIPKVGSIVGVRRGDEIVAARVIEDRGNLGVGGRRILRLEIESEFGGEPARFERPAEWLLPAPV